MIKLDARLDAPIRCKSVSSVDSGGKIDQPSRPDQLIVDVIARIVFASVIANAGSQRIIKFPMLCPQQRSCEYAVERQAVSKMRVIGDFLRLSPCLIRITMHDDTVIEGIFESNAQCGIIVVRGKSAAVGRQVGIMQFSLESQVRVLMQPLFGVVIQSDDVPGQHAEARPPMGERVVVGCRSLGCERTTGQKSEQKGCLKLHKSHNG